jgi:hypothetical protein
MEPKNIELYFENLTKKGMVGPLGIIIGEICELWNEEGKNSKKPQTMWEKMLLQEI